MKNQDKSREYIVRILNEKNKDSQIMLYSWYKPALSEEQRRYVQRHKNWMNKPLEQWAQDELNFKIIPDGKSKNRHCWYQEDAGETEDVYPQKEAEQKEV